MTKNLLSTELSKRVVSALVLGAICVALIILGNAVLLVGAVALTLVVAFEFYRLAALAGRKPFYAAGVIVALAFLIEAHFRLGILGPVLVATVLLAMAWSAMEEGRRRWRGTGAERDWIRDWVITFLGAFYTGGALSHIILLRAFPNGLALLFIVGLGAVACDVSAYLIGSTLGRHKFVPRISPKKTWEGTSAGFLAAVIVVLVGATSIGIGPLYALGWGCLLGAFQIGGDLVESAIKRWAGVKDSGSVIPGHGGWLDVIDGLLFSSVASYYYLVWIVGI